MSGRREGELGALRTLGAALALFSTLGMSAARAGQAPLADLDTYVHEAMTQWKVPGLAVAVVKDGHVVVVRGYGVRELGKPGRVDADTLFDIASNTKAFTAAALGTLVTAGKLQWDDPVIKYVPGFRLDNPYVTAEITLRDLLSHRSGYCDPGMWYTSEDTTANLVARLRFQQATFGFRAHFCYNNVMYMVASLYIPAITGESWHRYVATTLFAPLGMKRTVSTAAAVAAASNVARPHGEVDGKVEVIQPYWSNNMDVFAAVGGINSSVNDMSHWLLMLLADGRYQGKQVLEPAIIQSMETPQSLIQKNDPALGGWLNTQTPDAQFYDYGLGLFMQDYGGHKVVWHAGDIDGMASSLALVPDEHLGVLVLSNMNGNRAPEGVMFHVLQSYLGLPHRDVSAAIYAYAHKESSGGDALSREMAAAGHTGANAPLPLADYAGTYSDPFYGTALVGQEGGHLVLRFGNPMFVGDMQPWNGNTFRVRWRYRFYGEAYITFDIDELGKPTRLVIAQSPAHYERAPQAKSQ